MPADASDIVKRFERLRAQQLPFQSDWSLLGEFCLPRKRFVFTSGTAWPTPGTKITSQRLFDAEGIFASQVLASSLHGALTSPTQKWFNLVARDKRVASLKSVRDWAEFAADTYYLALGNSNWTAEVNENYLDLAVFGTAAMLQEERPPRPGGFGGLRFEAFPAGSFVIAEGPEQTVDTFIRRFTLPARVVVERWGKDSRGRGESRLDQPATLPREIEQMASTSPDKTVDLLHAVYPRPDSDRPPGKDGRKYMAWASIYLLERERHVLQESGYREFPIVVPRWTKVAGWPYGIGPAHVALPDIRTLNRYVEIYLAAGAKSVDPPLKQLHGGVKGNVTLEPAGLNVVTDMNSLAPLESGSRWEVAEKMYDRLEAKIRRAFYVDHLQLADNHEMTATEVVQRIELMQRILGPTAGRLHSEMLSPVITRGIAILWRAGVLPPPPPELLSAGAELDIQYEGPLARAQKSTDFVAIQRKNQYAATIAAFKPDIWDNWDLDQEAREVSELVGVPANVTRDASGVAQIRDQRAQQQQAAQQAQSALQMTEGAKNLAPLVRAIPSLQDLVAGRQRQAAA